MTGVERFSDNQRRALLALAERGSASEAASAAGLSERTLRRYREDPAFGLELARLRGAMLSEAVGEMLAAGSGAVAALKRACEATDERGRPRHSTQVRAASRLLELSFKGVELLDIEARLRELEHLYEQREREQREGRA